MQSKLQAKALQHVSRLTDVIGAERHSMLLDTLRDIIEMLPDRRDR
ncbi:MAG: hypothetical protein ACE368_00565 [Paracoccaceae bacterium]